jgi:type IV fimbrial biogenesis protein FimT
MRILSSNETGERGFTLLELMLVITIAAVILGVGVPNLRQFIWNNRLTAAANDLMTAVHTARTESVKRHAPVVMCFSSAPLAASPACDGTASQGWIVFIDDKNSDISDATDNNGVLDADEPIVLRHGALPDTLRVRTKPDGNKGYVGFTSAGFARKLASVGESVGGIVVCDSRGNVALYGPGNSTARGILISPTGRPRVTRSVNEIAADVSLGGCP